MTEEVWGKGIGKTFVNKSFPKLFQKTLTGELLAKVTLYFPLWEILHIPSPLAGEGIHRTI
jgi:hypothetical protein